MSETYQSKRERWQRLLEALPPGLREHVSLRNVEAVSALPPRAQVRLAEAIQAGLKRLPGAVEQLRYNPEASLADLLNPPAGAAAGYHPAASSATQEELADLIQACYPDMPRLSAESLAGAEAMQTAGQLAQAFTSMFASLHLKADFVLVVLYALLAQALERLESLVSDSPACRQALAQSRLPWIPPEWRKQDA